MSSTVATVAEVNLWGRTIGAVSWDPTRNSAYFEYTDSFRQSGIELAPFTMPLSDRIYSFPALPKESFNGLPGMLADSLPDDFGNALIDAWLAKQGRTAASFNPVERLCYMGSRAMGALEYSPAHGPAAGKSASLDIDALVTLAGAILKQKGSLSTSFAATDSNAVNDILRVGTSAGGARAKAIIAWNPDTGDVRSGQVDTGRHYSYWILKFDGVQENRDRESADPAGYGLIEYAYYHMACAAGIDMAESRLFRENNRAHFMTRRFDRTASGQKLHMQTLAALRHADYRQPGSYSYEQALQTIRKLGMTIEAVEQFYTRMVFNIVARNQDDHVKNISFLMTPDGKWFLAPAYDVTYSYNPAGIWTGQHQMTLNGKRDDFNLDDFNACATNAFMQKGRAEDIVRNVQDTVKKWSAFADEAGVDPQHILRIQRTHRLNLLA